MAVALLLMVLSLVAFSNGGAVYLSDTDKQEAVDVHNQYRIEAGATAMQKLKWNDALAQFAQNTADQCNFEHTSYNARQNIAGFSYIGENIYVTAGAIAQPTIKTATDDWASEKKDYDLNSNYCSASMCLHYTQIVWAQTTDVGCAVSKCSSVQGFSSEAGYIIFCNYGIGGNMIGEKPYEKASSGEIGSKCQQVFNKTADASGLCATDIALAIESQVTTVLANPETIGNDATTIAPADVPNQEQCN